MDSSVSDKRMDFPVILICRNCKSPLFLVRSATDPVIHLHSTAYLINIGVIAFGMDIFSKKKYGLVRHLLFWIGVWLFFVYFFSYNSENTTYILVFSTILLPITAATTYIIASYLIPEFLLTKNTLQFGLYLSFTMLFTTFCTLLALILSVAYIPGLRVDDMPPMSRNYAFILILVYLVVSLISFVSLWKYNLQATARNSKLHQKILETQFLLKEQELEYLKNQIHPHFLFNTLNTIYGFALKQSKETPDIILKLSDLLDYILYQVKKPRVSLQNEVNHIQQYIELEKIRFRDELEVSFGTSGVNEHIQIAPMIFLPFVENAFKHGSPVDGLFQVQVMINVEEDILFFEMKNTCTFKEHESGIGLENIKKRLELVYPESHDVQIRHEEHFFSVKLKIALSENSSL